MDIKVTDIKVIIGIDEATAKLLDRVITAFEGKQPQPSTPAPVAAAVEPIKEPTEDKPVVSQTKGKKVVKAPAVDPLPEPDIDPIPDPAPAPKPSKVTIDDVRAQFADKKRLGHGDALRAILTKHGAESVSKINPADYEAVLAAVKAL